MSRDPHLAGYEKLVQDMEGGVLPCAEGCERLRCRLGRRIYAELFWLHKLWIVFGDWRQARRASLKKLTAGRTAR